MTAKENIKNIETHEAFLFIALLALSAAVLILHAVRLPFNVFWVDTAFSADLIRLPLPEMIKATSVNEHPPFYYLFGKLVVAILGDHPWAFRATAFIPFAGIILLGLSFIRKEFGYAPAFIITGFASFTPASIVYVMETRMYELGCFLVLSSFLALYCLFTKPNGKRRLYWILFFLTSVSAAYTHYYITIAVCVMHLCLIIFCIRKKKELKICTTEAVLAIVSYLPWLGVMFRNFGVRAGDWWATDYAHFDETMSEIFGLKRFYVPALIVIAVLMIIMFIKKSDKRFITVTGILMIAVTFSAGAIVSEILRPLFLARYIYPLAGIGWLLLGMGIGECADLILKNRKTAAGILSGTACLALSLILIFTAYGYYRQDVSDQRAASAVTNEFLNGFSIPEGSVIYSDFEQEEFTIAGYYFPKTEVFPENALFYYTEPEYDSFYVAVRDSSVETVVQNLDGYGYESTVLAQGKSLGFQRPVSILFCEKY